MRRTDIEAVGDVAGEALAAGGGLVKELHEGIAGRPFGDPGRRRGAGPRRPRRRRRRRLRRRARRAAHGGARRGRASPPAAPRTPAPRWPRARARRSRSRRSTASTATTSTPAATASPSGWASAAAARTSTRPPAGLAAAFPDATSRLAVFVHGLGETDEAWRLLPLRGADRARRRTYGERLQDELSFTPLHLRYNTGLRISRNGRELARLLDDVVAGWPGGVEELVLVGHSMGGLVARSACHYGDVDGRRWTAAVRHVFCLGTPHLGADLEKGVNVLGWALGRLPGDAGPGATCSTPAASASRTCASARASRRTGARARTPTSSCATAARRSRSCPAPTTTSSARRCARGRSGRLLGDLLVRLPSASGRGDGRGRSIPFEVEQRPRAHRPDALRPAQPPGGLRAAAGLDHRGRRRAARCRPGRAPPSARAEA